MIPIYIGTDPESWLPTQVLKHSILAHTKAEIEFIDLDGLDFGVPRDRQLTGFSFRRWAVPYVNEYRDRALYLDSDIVVLGDVAELAGVFLGKPAAARPIAKNPTLGRYFTSVMVLDCAKLTHWDYRAWVDRIEDKGFYNATMWVRDGAPHADDFESMDRRWNEMDRVDDDTRLVHYTGLHRQPWRHEGHPAGQVFRHALNATLRDDAITAKQLDVEIRAGRVRANVLTIL